MLDAEANRDALRGTARDHLEGVQPGLGFASSKYYTIPPPVPYRGYQLKEITLVRARCTSGRDLAAHRER